MRALRTKELQPPPAKAEALDDLVQFFGLLGAAQGQGLLRHYHIDVAACMDELVVHAALEVALHPHQTVLLQWEAHCLLQGAVQGCHHPAYSFVMDLFLYGLPQISNQKPNYKCEAKQT